MKKYRRRHYFIDKGYQGRIIFKIILLCLAGVVIELGVFNYLAYSDLESLRWRVHLDISSTRDIIRSHLIVSGIISVSFTSGALFLFLRSIILRTAGPVFRLKKDIDLATEGDLSKEIWLRKEDDFKDTAMDLNKMIESFREDFRKIGATAAEIQRITYVLQFIEDKPGVATEKCDQLISRLDELISSASR
ncbi:MAG: methyl-accepting chemotaxis protein [Nitrospirae bacterium]|nr:methyl-accepting chemotaxis protein [Nitrospirota bacterium]